MNSKMHLEKMAIIYMIMRIAVAVLMVMSLFLCIFGSYAKVQMDNVGAIVVDMMGLIISVILLFGIGKDSIRIKQDRALARLISVMCFILFFDIRWTFVEGRIGVIEADITQVKVEYALLGICHALILYCYWAYIREEIHLSGKLLKYGNIIALVCTYIRILAEILNPIFGWLATFTSNGNIIKGKHRSMADLVSMVIFLLTILAIMQCKNYPSKQKCILMSFEVFPIAAVIVGFTWENYDYIFPAYVFSLLLIYINIFLEQQRRMIEQQIILEKQNTALMISQIQPHFLYNVLTTISNLCLKDPNEAQKTTILFAQYLRTNLDSLKKEEPVPFNEELDHIKIYTELEKRRFKSKLNVEYEIADVDFTVPSLGLQPLVENSVKHGICMKEGVGTVRISSLKDDKGHLVIIEDDGVGFDMAHTVSNDGREHVGLTNTVSRLEKMCKANISINTSPGCGCRIEILFPYE